MVPGDEPARTWSGISPASAGSLAAGLALSVWLIRAARVVAIPLAGAFFLAVLARPVHRALIVRLHPRARWAGLALVLLLIAGILVLLAGAAWISIGIVAGSASKYSAAVDRQWEAVTGWMSRYDLPLRENIGGLAGLAERAVSLATRAVASVWSIVAMLAAIVVLAIFLLAEWDAWRRRAEAAFAPDRTAALLETVQTVSRRIRRFLLVRIAVGSLSGISAGLFLWAMGVDFAFAWGVLAFVLGFVPYLGAAVTVAGPSLLALLQFGPLRALAVLAGLSVFEQAVGVVEPRLQGDALAISPFVLLLSLVFWTWMWGAAGIVLAVPMTVTAVAACSQIAPLRSIAALAGSGGGTPEK